jgi:RNA polymerase sigma-70 factor (ECF subfamily)
MGFEEVYRLYSNMVYNLSLSYVQNVEEAEEITQDVFLSVYEKKESFRGDAKVKTWIYRITINKSLDYLKAKKRKKRSGILQYIFYDKEKTETKEFSNFDHPGVELEQKEAVQNIFNIINGLSDNQKNAIIMTKIDGLSVKETAEIMELSPKAVESLIQRAKINFTNKMTSDQDL